MINLTDAQWEQLTTKLTKLYDEDLAQAVILDLVLRDAGKTLDGEDIQPEEIRSPFAWCLKHAHWKWCKQVRHEKIVPTTSIDSYLEKVEKGEDKALPESMIEYDNPEAIYLRKEAEQAAIDFEASIQGVSRQWQWELRKRREAELREEAV